MSKFNPALYDIAVNEVKKIQKQSFVPPPDPNAMAAGGAPMPPGGAPMDPAMMAGGGAPMDPAMMGGAPPMDPAMMAGGGAPMPPIDPAMLVEAMGAMAPPEGGEGAPAPSGGSTDEDIRSIIRDELTAAGVIKPKKMKPEDQYAQLDSKLNKLLEHFGIEVPPTPIEGEDENRAEAEKAEEQQGGAMGPGMSGTASQAALGSMQQPINDGATKEASGPKVASILKKLRGQ